MAQCKGCGKKGLFVLLNSRGLCKECTEKSMINSARITITTDGINTQTKSADSGHEEEEKACQYFIDELTKRGKDNKLFKIEHRASDYTSLVYDNSNDFIRIKITDNTAWISIAIANEDKQKYAYDSLFYIQENKEQRHWRSDFESIDQLQRYLDLAENACVSMSLGTQRTITEYEKKIADYIFDLFISCGAQSEDVYYYTLSQEFEILYKCLAGGLRFKAYAKKPGGYIRMDYYLSTKLKGEKNKFCFTDLSELDCLKDEIIPHLIEQGAEMQKYYNDTLENYKK